MKLKVGDYIELKGVSRGALRCMVNEFAGQGFNSSFINPNTMPIDELRHLFYGIGKGNVTALHIDPLLFSGKPRKLTPEQILNDDVIEDKPVTFPKQDKYKDQSGDADYLDRTMKTMTTEQFRGAMMWTVGKYIDRLGKKDAVADEVYKIADYASRWLEYEQSLPAFVKDQAI